MRRLLPLLLLVLAGCTPLYFPMDPGARPPEPRVMLEISHVVVEGRPELHILAVSVPEAGWLALQWFSPANQEVASESVWLTPDSTGLAWVLPLPADVEAVSGNWRALLSMHSVVIRQESVIVD